MKTDSIPAMRDLPAGRLAERKQHLLTEIAREPRPHLSLPPFRLPRLRVVALVGAGAGVAAVAAALALTLTGGSGNRPAPLTAFQVQAIHGPNWDAHSATNWGGNAPLGLGVDCTSTFQVFFGCNGALTLPEALALELEPSASAKPSSPARSVTKIDGGTPTQRALLGSIVAQMQPNSIKKIKVTTSGNKVTLRMTAVGVSLRTIWEESLVAAAFRDRAKDAGRAMAVALVNGDSNGGVIPPGPTAMLPAGTPQDADAARQRFEDAAVKIGVPLDELTIYRPDGVAVAATLKSSDPAAFLLHQMPVFLAGLGDRWKEYDGTYIRLVDDSGVTVWETSSTGRISSGAVGSRQDLAGCSPITNHGPTPPLCPAK